MKQCISAEGAPPALGPYSHAVRAGDYLYSSGQIPLETDGSGMVSGGLPDQTRQMMENLRSVLAAGGAGFEHVVKTTVFLTDMSAFQEFNGVYAEYFGDNPPARSCVEVSALPAGAVVEIEAVAYLGS